MSCGREMGQFQWVWRKQEQEDGGEKRGDVRPRATSASILRRIGCKRRRSRRLRVSRRQTWLRCCREKNQSNSLSMAKQTSDVPVDRHDVVSGRPPAYVGRDLRRDCEL